MALLRNPRLPAPSRAVCIQGTRGPRPIRQHGFQTEWKNFARAFTLPVGQTYRASKFGEIRVIPYPLPVESESAEKRKPRSSAGASCILIGLVAYLAAGKRSSSLLVRSMQSFAEVFGEQTTRTL